PALYAVHGALVRDVILREIRWELEVDPSGEAMHYVLSDLQPYGAWIRDDIAPELLAIIAEHPPKSERLAKTILSLLLSSATISDPTIASAAREQLKKAPDAPIRAEWFAGWASVETDEALDTLESEVSAVADPVAASEFAMRFAVALLG